MIASLLGVDFLCLMIGMFLFIRLNKVFQLTELLFRATYLMVPKQMTRVLIKSTTIFKMGDEKAAFDTLLLTPVHAPFYSHLELVLMWGLMAVFVAGLSNVVSTVIPLKQSSTSVFLASTVFFCIASLIAVNREGTQTDKYLSLGAASSCFLWCLLTCRYLSTVDSVLNIAVQPLSKVSGLDTSLVQWITWSSISLFVAIWAGAIVLPAFRYSRIYLETVFILPRETCVSFSSLFMAHFNFYSSALVCLMYLNNSPHQRIYAVLGLNFVRMFFMKGVMQGLLNSTFLILRTMSFSKFSEQSVEKVGAVVSQFSMAAALQYVAPMMAMLIMALLRTRVGGGDVNEHSRLDELIENVFQVKLPIGGLGGLVPASFLGPVIDNLILWMNLSWFACSLVALLHWKFESFDGNPSRKFAIAYTTK